MHACLSRPSVVGVAATRGTFEGLVAARKEPSRRAALPVCLQQKERLSTRRATRREKYIRVCMYIWRTYMGLGEKITDLVIAYSFFSFVCLGEARERDSFRSWMARHGGVTENSVEKREN